MATQTHVDLDRARIKELTEREAAKLNARTPGSQALYERARQSLVGGVASSYDDDVPRAREQSRLFFATVTHSSAAASRSAVVSVPSSTRQSTTAGQ